ncbi:rhomboid family intramembrane serine protease [Chryseobacterium sp. C-71]|uniref:rhomboid family intramembrane serine protease n=1 Tax=Chryseobacterium sp. C-71 TaxID=2893882 RepID=UPI001E3890B3|nr:rhomboid family intramembrane serine protease [Chryseobacterium sp. C-71]UFH30468.1 rhomboid family intramembrane serine protease [Chryseobacterium sp. C-71]
MFNNIPPLTKNIIILNIVVYVVTNFFLYALHNQQLYYSLAAFFPLSPLFKSWQIITHMFMHAPLGNGSGLMHIFFNMFTLFSFSFLENVLGGKRFLILYFLSGIGGFLLFNGWEFIQVERHAMELEALGFDLSAYFSGENQVFKGSVESIETQKSLVANIMQTMSTPLVGASGAIFGVVAAFATLFPNEKMIILFIPFPIKAKYLLIATVAGSIFFGINGNMGGIAHFAHVGGALVGYILARIWRKHLYRFNQH